LSYATIEELAEYTGQDAPDDAERLLDRASELMDYYTLQQIDTDEEEHAEAAKKAVCAQVEHWVETGDELGIISSLRSISIGSFSASSNGGQGDIRGGSVPPPPYRVRQALMQAGLLYRGVGMR